MNVVFWITVLVYVLAVYVSALLLALLGFSESALERRLEERDRTDAGHWLFERLDSTVLAVSLLRTVLRLAVFALVLVDVVGVGEDARLTWPALLAAGGISVALLWIGGGVVGSALARHASVGLLATGLPFLRAVNVVCLPLTRALSFVDEAIRRLTGANVAQQEEAEAELLRSIEDTQRRGALDEAAAALLENVVEFRSTDASEVMTPRTDIEGLEVTDDLATVRAFIDEAGHSRIPVYEESLDNILGILYVKDLVPYLGEDASDFEMRPMLRAPIMVPETKPVNELLADFRRSQVHLAIVIDEYGGTAGLVTIEDVLEEIVGEIHDEHEPEDEEEPSLDRIDDTRLEVDGRFYIDDLNERLDLGLPEDDDYDTIGGFVLAQLGHVPEVGETFESHNARFTAIAATPTHVQRIGIELLEAPAGNGQERKGNGRSNGKGDGNGGGSKTRRR